MIQGVCFNDTGEEHKKQTVISQAALGNPFIVVLDTPCISCVENPLCLHHPTLGKNNIPESD